MKALTLWQPWASLVALGAKPYEFRRWPAPAAIVVQRIAIHAGARPVRAVEVDDLCIRLRRRNGAGTGLDAVPALALIERVRQFPRSLPLSSILCTAVLGTPRKAADLFAHDMADSDRLDHSVWAWPLTELRRVEPMVPIRGAQGFWD